MTRAGIVTLIASVALSGALGWWVGARRPVDAAPRAVAAQAVEPSARKVLHYRNPMGLADTSPVPKKDSMGMDYVPVYADQVPAAPGVVVIAPEKVQRLGVRTEAVARRVLRSELRASGTIAVDETRRHVIAPRFEGWVERLYANKTGAQVRRGAPLADVYSPELVSAQNEFMIAERGLKALAGSSPQAQQGMQALKDAALSRLTNWQITGAQLDRLRKGDVRRLLTLSSPVDGVVMDKPAVEGMRFLPGERLLELADLSKVWLVAEIPTLEASRVELRQSAAFTSPALPGRSFPGPVEFIYPTVEQAARTIRVRVALDNPDGALRPNLYGDVVLTAQDGEPALAVPTSAVLDSGRRRIVLVALGEGRVEPREVDVARHDETHVEITRGLSEGERVVVSANFLIDAESNLRAALTGMGPESKGSVPGAGHQHGASPSSVPKAPDPEPPKPHSEHRG